MIVRKVLITSAAVRARASMFLIKKPSDWTSPRRAIIHYRSYFITSAKLVPPRGKKHGIYVAVSDV